MRQSALLLLLIPLIAGGCVHVAKKIGHELAKQKAKTQSLDVKEVDWAVRAEHPRLMTNLADWSALKNDPRFDRLRKQADALLNKPPLQYNGKKLLVVSREALKRIPTFAGMWRITHEQKYADAARKELLNVCTWDDWQPNDFLATSEMMMAVSIGYDWMHDDLSIKDRRTISDAIQQNGLDPAIDAYASGGGWTTAPHNWNLVCNGSVIVASLATFDDDAPLAKKMLALAMKSIRNGLATYDDCHGGWPEGPMYHNYATRYAIFAAAALESAPTKPVELSSQWLKDSALYRIYLTGPTGKSFNFGDSDEIIGNSAWLNWLGARYDPQYADYQKQLTQDDPSIFDLLWYKPVKYERAALPLVKSFPVCEVATLRSGWDVNDTFLAIKGGDNSFNHTHLDLGTFVLDMLGERFACELGADNYEMKGYLRNGRADYLRSATPGQNTLVIGDASQPLDGKGVIATVDEPNKTVKLDLTSAYPSTHSVTRTAVVRRNAVNIVDEIASNNPEPITWHMHTQAVVKVNGNSLLLTNNGKQIEMIVRSPKNATIELVEDKTRLPALPIEGVTNIRINVPAAKSVKIDVMFIAGG